MKKILLLLSVFIYAGAGAQLSSSLVACYALNGDAAEPISSLGGTVSGATAAADRNGNGNSAMRFAGSATCNITLPNNAKLKTSALSFAAWVKPASIASSQYIVFTKNTATSNFEAYGLALTAGQRFIAIKGAAGTVVQASCTSTINAGQWYHVVFTYDNVDLKMYVNGSLEGTVASTLVPDFDSNGQVVLGGSNESFNLPFDGTMDNVKFYNRVLGATEVTQLYSSDPACTASVGLVAQSQKEPRLKAFPNPTTGNLTLQLPGSTTGSYSISDLLGRSLLKGEMSAEAGIDLSALPQGIYLLEAAVEGGVYTQKIVKE